MTWGAFGLSAHALINVETAIALAFLVALYARSRPSKPNAAVAHDLARESLILLPLLGAPLAVAYARILNAPFVYDDYTHIAEAAGSNWRGFISLFGPAEHKPGLFFRPFGFLLYRINYLWAGDHAARWHAGSIALHAIVSCLVYVLCRKLAMPRAGAICASFLFAISACATEPVAWIDARFDLMATAFVLLALILTCQYLDSGHSKSLAAVLAAASAAVLSKESAFCLPALVVCIAFLRPEPFGRRARIAFLWIAALCVALFAYRWWAMGGIGGYDVRGIGIAGFLRQNAIPRANALFLREWAILFFPVNWSTPASTLLRPSVATFPAILAAAALLGRVTRRQLLACLGFTLAAALPAQKMLLIGLDLSGSRALYLPSIGIAILWGWLLGGLARGPQIALLCALVAIQAVTLEHNLTPWREVPELARSACLALGRQAPPDASLIVVGGLPPTNRGVVFLANGFPLCVQMNTGIPAGRIQIQGPSQRPAPGAFIWDDNRGFVTAGPN
jgi:hypothetical protein